MKSLSRKVALFLVAASAFAADTFVWDPSPDARVAGYKIYYSSQSFSALPPDAGTNPSFLSAIASSQASITIDNLVQGQTYYMTVVAFDLEGKESPSANILLYTAGEPIVGFTSPANNTSVAANTLTTITATVKATTVISKVEFFDNGTLIGTKTTAPYIISLGFSPGYHTLTAKATDANNIPGTSGPLTIIGKAAKPSPPSNLVILPQQ
jgi:hypothetical protein